MKEDGHSPTLCPGIVILTKSNVNALMTTIQEQGVRNHSKRIVSSKHNKISRGENKQAVRQAIDRVYWIRVEELSRSADNIDTRISYSRAYITDRGKRLDAVKIPA